MNRFQILKQIMVTEDHVIAECRVVLARSHSQEQPAG